MAIRQFHNTQPDIGASRSHGAAIAVADQEVAILDDAVNALNAKIISLETPVLVTLKC
jgi:hypothetical protein